MSEWITDRKPTIEDADCTGFVWITTDYGGVLREQWKTVRDRPWMPITIPEPYVEPPKRYKLMYRSTTRQYYIQDTESCDKRFVASCIPTREKAYRILNIFDEQNSMSRWITDRRPTEEDADYGDVHLNGYVYVTSEIGMTKTATWKAAAYKGVPWQPFSLPEPYVKPKHHFIIDIIEEWANGYGLEFSYENNYDKKTIYETIRRVPISIDLTGMDCETPELKKMIFDSFTETFDGIQHELETRKMKCLGMYHSTTYPHVFLYIRIDESVRYEQNTQHEEAMP